MTDIAVQKSLGMLFDNIDQFRNILPELGYEIGLGTIASGLTTIQALL